VEFTFAGMKTELEATCAGIQYQHLWTPGFFIMVTCESGWKCMPFLFE